MVPTKDQHAVRQVEKIVRLRLAAGGDQPLQQEPEQRHSHEKVNIQVAIDVIEEGLNAYEPPAMARRVGISVGPGKADRERNHQQERKGCRG
jgi:hypothetical protein